MRERGRRFSERLLKCLTKTPLSDRAKKSDVGWGVTQSRSLAWLVGGVKGWFSRPLLKKLTQRRMLSHFLARFNDFSLFCS